MDEVVSDLVSSVVNYQPLRFTIRHGLGKFCALETMGEKAEGTRVEEKWHDEYKGVLLSTAFGRFEVEKMNRQYSGTVEIELMGPISSGHVFKSRPVHHSFLILFK